MVTNWPHAEGPLQEKASKIRDGNRTSVFRGSGGDVFFLVAVKERTPDIQAETKRPGLVNLGSRNGKFE